MNASSTLTSLSRLWLRRQLWARAAINLAIGLPLMTLVVLVALTTDLFSVPIAVAIGCGAILAPLAWLFFSEAKSLGEQEVARQGHIADHLNHVAPNLEDSAELLLEAEAALPSLARLQRKRTQQALADLDLAALPKSLPTVRLRRSATLLLASLTLSAALLAFLPSWVVPLRSQGASSREAISSGGEVALAHPPSRPSFEQIEVQIAPPPYTGRQARSVQGLDLEAEEGSLLTWEIEVAGPATGVALLFADRTQPLHPNDSTRPTRFGGSLRLHESRVYQLVLEDEVGEVTRTSFARLVAVPDRPAQVRIVHPRPTVEVAADRPGVVVIEAEAHDDYGVASAVVIATLATGTGEQVQFREEEFAFDRRESLTRGKTADAATGGSVGARFSRRLDLSEFHLEAGSELFYFVEVTDNRQPDAQRSRSATQRIRVPGGSGASVALGSGLALRPVPEFFRSQRQIIIDTEKLLADRAQLSHEEFGHRAESIGFDQAALRHRYGNLLGLESQNGSPLDEARQVDAGGSTEGGGHHDDDHATPPPDPNAGPNFSGRVIDLVPAEFTHQHDSGEISTFFTDSIRSKLRACLAAMWEAERRLRTLQPRAALPHENEALTLLKEVQQAARVYVQRVGFEPPPLDPAGKRLTGELDKISSRRLRASGVASRSPTAVELALELLARLDLGLDASQRQRLASLLDQAARELARRSLDDPLTEIGALDDLRHLSQALLGSTHDASDPPLPVTKVEEALWRLVAEPKSRPLRRLPSGAGEMWSKYRDRLSEGG